MLVVGETFVSSRLGEKHGVDMFLERNPDEEKASEAITQAYGQARPKLPQAVAGSEICLLAVPPGPHEARFRELAHKAIPNVELVPAASRDDLIFYRQETQFPFTHLDHLGPELHTGYPQIRQD